MPLTQDSKANARLFAKTGVLLQKIDADGLARTGRLGGPGNLHRMNQNGSAGRVPAASASVSNPQPQANPSMPARKHHRCPR